MTASQLIPAGAEFWLPERAGGPIATSTLARTAERAGATPADTVELFHHSGKWSRTKTPAFDRNVRRMRKLATAGTRTEATSSDFRREVSWPGDGWGLWHPRGVGKDCATEWSVDEWRHLDHGTLPLTDIRIRTVGGHLLDPCTLVWVLLQHRETGVELELGAAHLDLSNTAKRRAANLESCHELRGHYRASQAKHPKRRHALQFDGNRDQHDPRWRAYFERELMAGAGLHSGWVRRPQTGTHGKKLLDLTATDLVGARSNLVPDDSASDHRPFVTRGRLIGA